MIGNLCATRYESAQRAGEHDEELFKREQARNALERYMHYYQRWAENDASRKTSRKAAQETLPEQLSQLSEWTATPTSQLNFISEAWDQVSASLSVCVSLHAGIACKAPVLQSSNRPVSNRHTVLPAEGNTSKGSLSNQHQRYLQQIFDFGTRFSAIIIRLCMACMKSMHWLHFRHPAGHAQCSQDSLLAFESYC